MESLSVVYCGILDLSYQGNIGCYGRGIQYVWFFSQRQKESVFAWGYVIYAVVIFETHMSDAKNDTLWDNIAELEYTGGICCRP